MMMMMMMMMMMWFARQVNQWQSQIDLKLNNRMQLEKQTCLLHMLQNMHQGGVYIHHCIHHILKKKLKK